MWYSNVKRLQDFFTIEFLYKKHTTRVLYLVCSISMTDCMYCPSDHVRKNWKLSSGGQRWKCAECDKQFSTWWARDTYSPEFKKQVIDEYCHSPSGSKTVLKKYGISSRTLVKRKKEHLDDCPSCVS